MEGRHNRLSGLNVGVHEICSLNRGLQDDPGNGLQQAKFCVASTLKGSGPSSLLEFLLRKAIRVQMGEDS